MTNNIKIFKLQKWRNFVSTHPRVHVVDVSSVRGLGTLQSFILLEIELIHTFFKRGLSGLHNRCTADLVLDCGGTKQMTAMSMRASRRLPRRSERFVTDSLALLSYPNS
jgi:hypothetical protein